MLNQNLTDRVRRADSWMKAAARLQKDQLHETFLFLYIAFNCLYGRRQYDEDEGKIGEDLKTFFRKIVTLAEYDKKDGERALEKAIAECRGDGAILIRDRFLDNRYWRRDLPVRPLHEQLKSDAKTALEQLAAGDPGEFLLLTFRRVSVLRNQIMHGCATYGPGSAGRPSVAIAVRVMNVMIPAFHSMIRNYGSHVEWDPIPYPRLGSAQHSR
jgi:hypothetical protein